MGATKLCSNDCSMDSSSRMFSTATSSLPTTIKEGNKRCACAVCAFRKAATQPANPHVHNQSSVNKIKSSTTTTTSISTLHITSRRSRSKSIPILDDKSLREKRREQMESWELEAMAAQCDDQMFARIVHGMMARSSSSSCSSRTGNRINNSVVGVQHASETDKSIASIVRTHYQKLDNDENNTGSSCSSGDEEEWLVGKTSRYEHHNLQEHHHGRLRRVSHDDNPFGNLSNDDANLISQGHSASHRGPNNSDDHDGAIFTLEL